jgi:hypothetical protein
MITIRLKFRCPWCLKREEVEVALDPAQLMSVDIDEYRACQQCKKQFTGKA